MDDIWNQSLTENNIGVWVGRKRGKKPRCPLHKACTRIYFSEQGTRQPVGSWGVDPEWARVPGNHAGPGSRALFFPAVVGLAFLTRRGKVGGERVCLYHVYCVAARITPEKEDRVRPARDMNYNLLQDDLSSRARSVHFVGSVPGAPRKRNAIRHGTVLQACPAMHMFYPKMGRYYSAIAVRDL